MGMKINRRWDWLVQEARDARFTLIGEEHGVAETAQFSAALFNALRGSGYSRMAIELSPIIAQDNEAAARRNGLQGCWLIMVGSNVPEKGKANGITGKPRRLARGLNLCVAQYLLCRQSKSILIICTADERRISKWIVYSLPSVCRNSLTWVLRATSKLPAM
jgi:hypothetical protein